MLSKEDVTYVALGDSITAYRNGVKVYMEWLIEERESLGLTTIINNGLGGWNTAHLLEKLEERCLQHQPQLVSIMLGTNDHAIYKGQDRPAISVEEYKYNLREIVMQMRVSAHKKGAVSPSILLMSPPYIATYTNEAGTQVSQSRLLEYVEAICDISNELGTDYLDINAITASATKHDEQLYRSNYTDNNDGVHLNTAGQYWLVPYMKETIYKAAAKF